MILQCMKCDLYFRSFSRIKYHKALQCAGENRDKIKDEQSSENNIPDDNPWSYNLQPSLHEIKKEEELIKPEVKSENDSLDHENVAEKNEIKSEPDPDFESSKIASDEVKKETVIDNNAELNSSLVPPVEKSEEISSDPSIKNSSAETELKTEEENVDDPIIKDEPMDVTDNVDIPLRRDPYAGGVYKPAAVLVDSDSEYEAESDDSAPDDDDIESHLGMLTKWNPHKADKPKIRKRKRAIPEDAKIVIMVSASGQQVKKIKLSTKDTTRWVPPHPWIPYPHQVTVEQCCQYLELKDYPIVVNEDLKEKFKDKKVFDDYALPLLKSANPSAHPLTLSTLMRAKWFEVMNTETAEGGTEENNQGGGDSIKTADGEDTNTNESETTKPVMYTRQNLSSAKPIVKNIKLNF